MPNTLFTIGFATILPFTSLSATTNYLVRGVLENVDQPEHQLVIAHEAIPNFMDAMTMPFPVKDDAVLTNLPVGKPISFQLHVTETESWIDHIQALDGSPPVPAGPRSRSTHSLHSSATINPIATNHSTHPLRSFKFTNELGQAISLSDFRGQAIALTFFFTRCPIPEFCPRLSRNFEAVQLRLKSMPNAPTNWHLLSVTFDPIHDTPDVLKAYAASYQYDPAHWSFLTGPADKITELARACDVKFDPENGLFNHNFRTLIIDAHNHLQTAFPTSGDISQSIVQELLKAAAAPDINMGANSAGNIPPPP